jgi:hypothetical protein
MTTAELVEANNQKQESPLAAAERPDAHVALFEGHEVEDLRSRWQRIQGEFVDDPHASVEKADQLVAAAIQRLAEIFAQEKSSLESSWSRGTEISTEDMRQALRRYRSFFDRILSV